MLRQQPFHYFHSLFRILSFGKKDIAVLTKRENFYNLFDTLHDPKSKKYFGEDFGFCQRWTDIGGEIYLYIMDYITHIGEYQYCGRFWDELLHVKRIDDPSKIK